MRGPFFGLVLILVVPGLVAWGIWAMRRRPADPETGAGRRKPVLGQAESRPAPSVSGGGLAADLGRWAAAGLISGEQAEAIAAHERGLAVARAPGGERRVSLIAEALGYVGTALALAGAAVGLGQTWEKIPAWGQLVIAAGATVLLLVGGLALLSQTEPAFRRLQSVLWFLAVGAAAWALVVLSIEYLGLSDDDRMLLLAGAGTAVLAGVLYAIRRNALQHVALFAASLAALIGAVLCLPGEAPIWGFALLIWALGTTWGMLGWRRLLEPWWLATAVGAVGAVVGPSIGINNYPWLLAIALATSVFLMVMSVPTGQVPFLAVGTVGTFGYVTWAVFRYFGDSLGVPLTLVIIGGVFIALAVVAGRLTQVTRSRRHRPGSRVAGG